jgi:hypothetical protein
LAASGKIFLFVKIETKNVVICYHAVLYPSAWKIYFFTLLWRDYNKKMQKNTDSFMLIR